MSKLLLVFGIFGWAAVALRAADTPAKPILVELFTSEGCSSCPPADTLLGRLEREQPVPGAQVIVLSEHVDYWNSIGWKDPFSSAAFSARQNLYVRRLGVEGPYTPQMVVDGTAQFVGSDAKAALAAIKAAVGEPKTGVRLRAAGESVAVEVDPLAGRKGKVYLAYAADTASSDVLRGENKGRRLQHVAVVKSLREIGAVESAAFHGMVPAQAGLRVVVFVQDAATGKVWGAAMTAVPR